MHDPTTYYAKRKREFEGRLASARSKAFLELLGEALSLTESAVARVPQLVALVTRVGAFTRRVAVRNATELNNTERDAALLVARLESILQDPAIDQEQKRAIAALTKEALASTKSAATTIATCDDLFIRSFQNSVAVLVDTLALKLLRPDHTAFILNAVREGIIAAIGAIPVVGDLASGVESITSVVSFSGDQFRAADDYALYLEQYVAAAEMWKTAVATFVTLYENAMADERNA